MRETPNNRFQRFVEFYDVRDAAKAMTVMNGKQIFGKNAVVQFSRPGGQCRRLWKGSQNGSSRNPNSPTPITSYSSRKCSPPYRPRPPPPPQPPRRCRGGNPSGSDGSKSSSSGSSFHGSVSNLCISGGYEECSSNIRGHKKTGSKKGSNGGGSKQSSHGGGGWPWKGGSSGGGGSRRGKEHDPRFLINEDAIVESNCRDPRTTVMIKNIPNKYR